MSSRGDEPDVPPDPEDPGKRGGPPSETDVCDALSREILRIHTESYGSGAVDAQAFIGEDWVVVLLEDLELLPNEKFLVENGESDSVTQVRAQYQLAIQSSFRAAVERATGRSVIGFTSATSIEEPRFGAEIFRLG